MKQNVLYTQPPSTFGRVDQMLPSTLSLAVGTEMSYSLHRLHQRDLVFCSQGATSDILDASVNSVIHTKKQICRH